MPDPPPSKRRVPQYQEGSGAKVEGQRLHKQPGTTASLLNPSPFYAELHCRTNYSFLEGGSHPDELVHRAKELGLRALAITDRNSLAGVVRAHVAAKDAGLKLLIGAEITPSDAPPVLLLATDRAAYGRLSSLLTLGRRRAPKGECDLTFADIADNAEGLLACVPMGRTRAEERGLRADNKSGQSPTLPPLPRDERAFALAYDCGGEGWGEGDGIGPRTLSPSPRPSPPIASEDNSSVSRERGGDVSAAQTICNPQSSIHASSFLSAYRDLFGDRCYALAELHRGGNDRRSLQRMIALAANAGVPLAAANDVHYHVPERRFLHDVLTAIRHGCTVAELGRRRFSNAERYLKSPIEMATLFAECRSAVDLTVEIADRCTFSLDELRYEYPHELCPPETTPLEFLKKLTWDGAHRRYPLGLPEKIRRLIEHELQLIEELHYEAYFLTVWDLVRFARGRGILCQGRGSAANSAVCYCLEVTSVDPDRIDVLFERFISKERDEAPDIDVDFEHERREEVIQYVYDKYGRERAGMAATVICYRYRSAVRDVGKALGLSPDRVDVVAKGMERGGGEDKLAGRLREAGLKPLSRLGRQFATLVNEIQDFPRHLSQHVGGLVLTERRLSEIVPIENASMPGRTVIQWDKDDLDALGILKVDCLALGMLTAIRKAFDMIEGWKAKHKDGQSPTMPPLPRDQHPSALACDCRGEGRGEGEKVGARTLTPSPQPSPPITPENNNSHTRGRGGSAPAAQATHNLQSEIRKTTRGEQQEPEAKHKDGQSPTRPPLPRDQHPSALACDCGGEGRGEGEKVEARILTPSPQPSPPITPEDNNSHTRGRGGSAPAAQATHNPQPEIRKTTRGEQQEPEAEHKDGQSPTMPPLPRDRHPSALTCDCGGEGRGEGEKAGARILTPSPQPSPPIASENNSSVSRGRGGSAPAAQATHNPQPEIRKTTKSEQQEPEAKHKDGQSPTMPPLPRDQHPSALTCDCGGEGRGEGDGVGARTFTPSPQPSPPITSEDNNSHTRGRGGSAPAAQATRNPKPPCPSPLGPEPPLTLASVPPEDPVVYEMIQRADTIGVFQIESRAQMSMLPRLRPQEFYDLVIEVAIVRPGPIQGKMVHPYLRRRNKEEPVEYPDERVKAVLEKTLGVPLFQEQAMRLAVVAAGFTPGEADQLRRAMGAWRKRGVIDVFRRKLIEGMRSNGYSDDFAERLFNQIRGFGEYGFPESHAASFALLVYVSAWLKRHHPAAFTAALLNSQPMGFYAPAQLIADARNHEVEVLPVDVNLSDWDCTLEGAEHKDGQSPTMPPLPRDQHPSALACDCGGEGRGEGEKVGPRTLTPSPQPSPPIASENNSSVSRGRGGSAPAAQAIHNPQPEIRKTTRGEQQGPEAKHKDGQSPTMPPLPRDQHPSALACDCGGEGRGEGDGVEARILTHPSIRLGFRMIRGLSQTHVERILEQRSIARFTSFDDFARRTGLSNAVLKKLSQADAFGSLDVGRREALWKSLPEQQPLPLFAETVDEEPAVNLPVMSRQEEVVADYKSNGLSLRGHPIEFVRPLLEQRKVVKAADLATAPNDRPCKVAGLVLLRQRPGTAKGITFVTLEDETGTANLIIRQEIWERYQRVASRASAMIAHGTLQRQNEVIHLLVHRLQDLAQQLAPVEVRSRDFR